MSSRTFESESMTSQNAYSLLRAMSREGKINTTQLSEETNSSYGKTTSYLTGLNKADFVTKSKDGRTVYYSVKYRGFLDKILEEAREELEQRNIQNKAKYKESIHIVEDNRSKLAGLFKYHIDIHMDLHKESNVHQMIFNKFQASLEGLNKTDIALSQETIKAMSDTLKLANGIYLTEDYVTEFEQKDLTDLELDQEEKEY